MSTSSTLSSQQQLRDDLEVLLAHSRELSVGTSKLSKHSTLSLSYLTEGAANVIWLIHIDYSRTPSDQHDISYVLRTRKDLSSTVPLVQARDQFNNRVVPLFSFNPSLLLPVNLISLSSAIIQHLNNLLVDAETTSKRKSAYRQVYLPSFDNEPHASVMPNLLRVSGVVIEFKPKWLLQSPSAPANAQRCRTCALNALRRQQNHGSGRGDGGFCPLNLLSRNMTILQAALRNIWPTDGALSSFTTAFRLTVQPSLLELAQLQHQHNGVGLNDFLDAGKDFSVAMALRDCSVLIRTVQKDQDVAITDVKLLDLDLKDSGGGKREKWVKMEQELIDGGWYTSSNPQSGCALASRP
ncbi:hypothetical protein BT93_L0717 [Corymbia citriodora subsp. variegata]|uniref:Inositol-pentakisphosphate 2-kinase n=1 Tax=Corymbia citriodora subsp. variegata TaxID=360336 RepID=A0A8T0CIJ0_CORYI|nr:hypothetical protein BT93_L0717 [Corymbia citriodora subsp. variegata]